ncbi:MAG: glycoside hydrolase family 5 protein [Planctomycetota bacterium]
MGNWYYNGAYKHNSVCRKHITAVWFTGNSGYRTIFDNALTWCNENNMYLIIDQYRYDTSDSTTGVTSGPNLEAFINVWEFIANRYKNAPNIIYEIGNEQHGTFSPANPSGITTHWQWSQECINAIRNIDPDSIIIVPMDYWAHWGNNAVRAPLTGGNIAYDFHIYYYHSPRVGTTYSQVSNYFDAEPMVDLVHSQSNQPVICGEFGVNYTGTDATQRAFFTSMCQVMTDKEMSWQAWSFDDYGSGFYLVLNHTNHAPTQTGAILHQYTEQLDGGVAQHQLDITSLPSGINFTLEEL